MAREWSMNAAMGSHPIQESGVNSSSMLLIVKPEGAAENPRGCPAEGTEQGLQPRERVCSEGEGSPPVDGGALLLGGWSGAGCMGGLWPAV
ncbi:hypothetical protein Spiaf_2263 [Spirochaeta africana DSM 8902]|uniref:Uncharacterized protein n=1 Tax=Spirochaeta africana (strain ATCC 700263 / DSM 8902 / Z-7692) TaxID=889378 RepID=H9ULA6_SPIAZ|nr:hypothetical protein Spiaf_2263 [Spirochaeta africana DSM 8902]